MGKLARAEATLVKVMQSGLSWPPQDSITKWPLRASSVPDTMLGLGGTAGERPSPPPGHPEKMNQHKPTPLPESGRPSWSRQRANWGVKEHGLARFVGRAGRRAFPAEGMNGTGKGPDGEREHGASRSFLEFCPLPRTAVPRDCSSSLSLPRPPH